MSKQFAYPLAIRGTKEQLDALADKLELLGYNRNGCWFWSDEKHLTTSFGDINGEMGYSAEHNNSRRTYISADNEELVLALAAMTTDPAEGKGEWFICIRQPQYNQFTKGMLYQLQGNKLTEPMAFIQDAGERNGFSEDNPNYFRKATKEEIIAHFTKSSPVVDACPEPEFVLPESWYIKITEENREVVSKWFNDEDKMYSTGAAYGILRGKKCAACEPQNFSGTEITFEQFQKYVLKQTTMSDKKIIGYKAPIDLFNGTIKAGTVYIIRGKDYGFGQPKDYSGSGSVVPREIIETWEPVYEEEFKEGDWIFIESGVSSWLEGHQVVQLGGKFWGQYGVRNGHISAITGAYPEGNSGLFEQAKYRKATPQEVQEASNLRVKGYNAVKEGDMIAFGCRKFTLADLVGIRKLYHPDIEASITIAGQTITDRMIDKLINKLK